MVRVKSEDRVDLPRSLERNSSSRVVVVRGPSYKTRPSRIQTRTFNMWKVTTVILVITIGIALYFKSEPTKAPVLSELYWGPGKEDVGSTDKILPFKIDVPKSVIDDLKERLSKPRAFVEPLENTGWTYGVSTKYLNTVIDYWRSKYNWNERQALLNKYPQYKTKIQGLDIHFYRVKPSAAREDRKVKSLPLLLVHGWPGSVVEFQKIIPLLTKPRADHDFAFELIIPSLPGYGFSQGAVRRGLDTAQMAIILKNLMLRLGFDKFYTQGGDWGSAVTADLAALYPQHVLGAHSNMCFINTVSSWFWMLVGSYVPSLVVEAEHYSKLYPIGHHFSRMMEESGYLHLQASKPDTVAVAVGQSPISLAAYVLEKFSTWTNPEYRFRDDGGLLEKFTLDELIDNLMVYWVTNSMTTSMRLYAEQLSPTTRDSKIDQVPLEVPTACAFFPHEIAYRPPSLIRERYQNLLQSNHLPRGGHFAAFEEPQLVADDVFSFVKIVEQPKMKEEEKILVRDKNQDKTKTKRA